MSIFWIDKPAQVEDGGDAFKLTLTSGDEPQQYAMPRHILRRIVEEGRRVLDEAEARDGLAVIEFRQRMFVDIDN